MVFLTFLILFFSVPDAYSADLAIVHGYVRHVVTAEEFQGLKLKTIEVEDPLYKKHKRYAAYWVPDILKLNEIYSDSKTVWVFTNPDGYQTRVEVAQAIADKAHAYLAVKDLDESQGWEKVRQGNDWVTPGPYYLVWETPTGAPRDKALPWTYGISEISVWSTGKTGHTAQPATPSPKTIETIKALPAAPARSENIVTTYKTDNGWELLVNDKPFLVHGMCYYPTTIGETPENDTRRNWEMVDDNHDGRNDFGYKTWIWNKRVEVGDFKLMQRMGVNTIRIYQHVSNNPYLEALNASDSNDLNYPPKAEKKILRQLYYKFGIMTAMGDLLGAYTANTGASWEPGTDYTDPTQRANMLRSVRDMVEEHKNEPYVLMWILGNENDLSYAHTNAASQPEAYARLVNEAAALIKKIDKDHHPVAVCNGSEALLKYYARYAPQVDIFGINMYQITGFHDLWKDVAKTFDRPVLLTEFGTSHPLVVNGKLNEKYQLIIHRFSWEDIYGHSINHGPPGNAIGGFVFEWVDNWWQDGDPLHQNPNPDGSGWNHEYNGICSMGDGSQGSLQRHLRKVYWMYRNLWKKE